MKAYLGLFSLSCESDKRVPRWLCDFSLMVAFHHFEYKKITGKIVYNIVIYGIKTFCHKNGDVKRVRISESPSLTWVVSIKPLPSTLRNLCTTGSIKFLVARRIDDIKELAPFKHKMTDTHLNSWRQWQHIQDLPRFKQDKIPAWQRNGHKIPLLTKELFAFDPSGKGKTSFIKGLSLAISYQPHSMPKNHLLIQNRLHFLCFFFVLFCNFIVCFLFCCLSFVVFCCLERKSRGHKVGLVGRWGRI